MDYFNCDSCGRLPYAQVDGYAFGERLLEGVTFQLRIKNKKVVATTDPKDKEYMESTNEKKWLKEAAEFGSHTDTLTCPKCGNDIDGFKEEGHKDNFPKGVPGVGHTIDDVFREIRTKKIELQSPMSAFAGHDIQELARVESDIVKRIINEEHDPIIDEEMKKQPSERNHSLFWDHDMRIVDRIVKEVGEELKKRGIK